MTSMPSLRARQYPGLSRSFVPISRKDAFREITVHGRNAEALVILLGSP